MDAMATPQRRPNYTLEEQLYSQPYEFDYHQAVRILEKLKPDGIPLGEGDNPEREAVQLSARVTLSVSSADIYSLKPSTLYPDQPVMTINFLGLAGIQGPLPNPYAEMMIERLRRKDVAMRDFLDIFNHRLISFWHRVRKKIVLGMAQVPPEQTPVAKSFLNLLGFDYALEQKTYPVPLRSLLKYVPLFWQRPRSLSGLLTLLKGYFPYNVSLTPLIPGWQKAGLEDRTRIGTSGQFSRLGQDTILGHQSWNQGQGISIHFNGLDWLDYVSYLPGGRGYQALQFLAHLYCEPTLKIHLKVTIHKHTIPPLRLGHKHFLGCTTFLTRGKGKGFEQNPEVLVNEFLNHF
jgi:type VI secretion system protein ImpH